MHFALRNLIRIKGYSHIRFLSSYSETTYEDLKEECEVNKNENLNLEKKRPFS